MWPFSSNDDPNPRLKSELGTFEFQHGIWISEVKTSLGRIYLHFRSAEFEIDAVQRFQNLLESLEATNETAISYLKLHDPNLLQHETGTRLMIVGAVLSPGGFTYELEYGYEDWPDFGVTIAFDDGVPIRHECGD